MKRTQKIMFETKLTMQTWLHTAHTFHPWQCPRSLLRCIRSSSGLGFVHFNTYKDEAKDKDKTRPDFPYSL